MPAANVIRTVLNGSKGTAFGSAEDDGLRGSSVLVTDRFSSDLSDHAEGTAGGYGDAHEADAERLSDGPRRS
jgi:hypothetical protein